MAVSTIATDTPPQEAYALTEATAVAPAGSVDIPEDIKARYSEEEQAKMVPLHVIRPGLGRGRGRHLYEANMLAENADKFRGWKMFVDHQSQEARRRLGGLPRSLLEAGGVLKESWWDPTIPADERFGQGAVVGWAKPTRVVRELVDDVPEFVEASIRANATGVRAVHHGGERAWLVEGIEDRGTVDWVTEAGAGGRVIALMEAAADEEEMGLLETLSDTEFLEYLRDQRPHLLEALEDSNPNPAEGGDMGDFTPEALQEALQTEEFQGVLNGVMEDRLAQTEQRLDSLVEAKVAEERELIRAEARADADRQIELRDLRDEARKTIEESKLHPILAEKVRTQFDMTDTGPTPALDVVDEVDDDGNVTKPARQKLREAVQKEVEDQRSLLAAVNPTRVKGQGPKAPAEGEDPPKKSEGTLWGEYLQEAGVDPETAYQE